MSSADAGDKLSSKLSEMDLPGKEELNLPGSSMLLDLPETARDIVLNYLDVWALMDFRLICKETQKWVDTTSQLHKFVLGIESHSQMEDAAFKKSEVPWHTVIIRCDAYDNDNDWIYNPLYSNLLQKLSSSLVSLHLADHRIPLPAFWSIFNVCESLTELNIGTLVCTGWTDEANEPNVNMKTKQKLNQLESLSIEFISWEKEEELDLLKFIFQSCRSLIFLKTPHLLMAPLIPLYEDEENDFLDKRYLELVNAKIADAVVELLTSTNNPRYIDAENMHQTEIFPNVAMACFKTGSKLMNVSEAYEEPIPATELNFLETIESLSGFTKFLDLNKLKNLKYISLNTETSADSDVDDNFIQAPLPKLRSVSLCFPGDISKNIPICFLQHCRPNVISLVIEFQEKTSKLSRARLFQASDLIQNFSHLKSLVLMDWDGTDNDLSSFFKHLVLLKNLKLQGCMNISDRGFLGENPAEPVMLNLKKLETLWIDCQISNDVLKFALRHLRLRSLFYSSEEVTLPGFLTLTQGPLIETLIIFQVISPEGCTEEILQRFVSSFKVLKRKPVLFSAQGM